MMNVAIEVNGIKIVDDVEPDTTLFEFLRAHGFKSVKCGCETTNCGLCTVWLDEEPMLSCATFAVRVDGRRVTTLEGLQAESAALARCIAEEGAEQCGFCAPGLVMSVLALERAYRAAGHAPTPAEADHYLAGNLCRCTGYMSQRRAIYRYLAECFDDFTAPDLFAQVDPVAGAAAAGKEA